MKLLLVSDSHNNIDILKKIIIKHYDCDYYIHLGDSQLNKELLNPFISVKGNCDYDNFPLSLDLNIEDFNIHFEHGHFINKSLHDYLNNINCDIFIFGHTHKKMYEKINGKIVINPGSLTRPKDCNEGSYVILQLKNHNIINCQFFNVKL